MAAYFPTDQNLTPIHAPTIREVISSGTSYTPTKTHSAILGADATITVDGNAISLPAGLSFIMVAGVTYAFATTTPLAIS